MMEWWNKEIKTRKSEKGKRQNEKWKKLKDERE